MTTYKGIRGLTIRTVAGDTDPVALGDIWYNNVAKKIRIGKTTAASWSTGGNLNQARVALGAFGSQTANAVFGGFNPPAILALVEEYDGTSWTEVTDLPTSIYRNAGCGTQTAGLTMPGRTSGNTTETYEYDGTNWTETGDYPVSTSRTCAAGTQTAGLGYSGYNPAGNKTSEYNGSTWTEVNNLGTSRYNSAFGGLQTAALFITGYPESPPTAVVTNVESYDGTNWTEIGDVNTARAELASTIQGTPSSMVIYGGGPPTGALTETWDGTSWTETTDMPAAKGACSGGGTEDAGLVAGGNPGVQATVFEFKGVHVAAGSVTSS